ncbi:MAG: NAD(+)--rifampin ADP-ribosyltransferase [Leptolyngbya sp. UWPOB_LEPTO1]|nr:NAD(+)--rifampin ADP-ribosyltransferase [Leptolyngbya sp. UWPOB_LEPTO1]
MQPDRKRSEPMAAINNLSSQQFYHGTKADLRAGDLIESCNPSSPYVYLTPNLDAAIWGAELALGEGRARIYIVEPTGLIEDDLNVTNQKFPRNPTKSYRSREPLRVMGEVIDWQGHSPEALNTKSICECDRCRALNPPKWGTLRIECCFSLKSPTRKGFRDAQSQRLDSNNLKLCERDRS